MEGIKKQQYNLFHPSDAEVEPKINLALHGLYGRDLLICEIR
jgi:hypothetical protein